METIHKELRFDIPKVLLEAFAKNPRCVLKSAPAGLWPVDLKLLSSLERLVRDEEFNANFEIVIMPK